MKRRLLTFIPAAPLLLGVAPPPAITTNATPVDPLRQNSILYFSTIASRI
jgi:hypothetical protein